jgi:hypothetical protein
LPEHLAHVDRLGQHDGTDGVEKCEVIAARTKRTIIADQRAGGQREPVATMTGDISVGAAESPTPLWNLRAAPTVG